MAEKEKVEEGKGQDKQEKVDDKPKPVMIPKDRLDEVISERNELAKRIKAAEDAQAKAKADALAEQGKFKDLYETARKEAEEARSSLEQMRVDGLRREAATAAGHPQLWDRVRGQTPEEIKADMEALVAAIPAPKAPGIDGGTGSGARSTEKTTKVKLSDKNKEYLAGILGVAQEYLPDEV